MKLLRKCKKNSGFLFPKSLRFWQNIGKETEKVFNIANQKKIIAKS